MIGVIDGWSAPTVTDNNGSTMAQALIRSPSMMRVISGVWWKSTEAWCFELA